MQFKKLYLKENWCWRVSHRFKPNSVTSLWYLSYLSSLSLVKIVLALQGGFEN